MGTKMSVHRYSPSNIDWDTTEYIVDDDFLTTYGGIDPILPTGYLYEPGKDLLKVYFNGQRLSAGGAYVEVDEEHIQLALGNDSYGNPLELLVGEEIVIEVYKNLYCSRGQATISGTQFYELQKEVRDARNYGSTQYSSLDSRLDEIQSLLSVAYGDNANIVRDYEYNDREQIIKEVISGDYSITRELTYFDDDHPTIKGEISTETITYTRLDGSESVVVKSYTYDLVTRKMLREEVSVVK